MDKVINFNFYPWTSVAEDIYVSKKIGKNNDYKKIIAIYTSFLILH